MKRAVDRVERMPRQNRVTPFGTIVRPPDGSAARGDWFGNRGCLHEPDGQIVRRWRSRAWLICRLAFKGRRRRLLMPGRYTELFFLDEASAFAAGHRPCGECRWHDYQLFRRCWPGLAGRPITELDAVLHAERVDRAGQLVRPATIERLPDGAFVTLPETPDAAYLVWAGRLYPWSLDGYGAPIDWPTGRSLRLLTPPSLIATIERGYRVSIHASVPRN
jgi:hypothetical protein